MLYSFLLLPPAYEHSAIYLQLCMWDDYHLFLIASFVTIRLLLDEFYHLIELLFWLTDDAMLVSVCLLDSRFLLQYFVIWSKWIWTPIDYHYNPLLEANWLSKCTSHPKFHFKSGNFMWICGRSASLSRFNMPLNLEHVCDNITSVSVEFLEGLEVNRGQSTARNNIISMVSLGRLVIAYCLKPNTMFSLWGHTWTLIKQILRVIKISPLIAIDKQSYKTGKLDPPSLTDKHICTIWNNHLYSLRSEGSYLTSNEMWMAESFNWKFTNFSIHLWFYISTFWPTLILLSTWGRRL